MLDADFALKLGASGPVLRASGVRHDLRKDAPYAAYAEVEFEVPTGEYGDTLDRYRVRFVEMRESVKILQQCAEWLETVGRDSAPAGRPLGAGALPLNRNRMAGAESRPTSKSPRARCTWRSRGRAASSACR